MDIASKCFNIESIERLVQIYNLKRFLKDELWFSFIRMKNILFNLPTVSVSWSTLPFCVTIFICLFLFRLTSRCGSRFSNKLHQIKVFNVKIMNINQYFSTGKFAKNEKIPIKRLRCNIWLNHVRIHACTKISRIFLKKNNKSPKIPVSSSLKKWLKKSAQNQFYN